MTPEQRAATISMVRRVLDGEDGATVYGCRDWQTFYRADKGLLLRDYLAEHPADDDEPVTFRELNDVECFHVYDHGHKLCVEFDGDVEIKTRGQLRRLRKELEGK